MQDLRAACTVIGGQGTFVFNCQPINSWIKYNQLPLFLKLKVPKEGM